MTRRPASRRPRSAELAAIAGRQAPSPSAAALERAQAALQLQAILTRQLDANCAVEVLHLSADRDGVAATYPARLTCEAAR